jgi:hypothetical protein
LLLNVYCEFNNGFIKYNYNGNPVDPRKEKKKPDPFALVEPIQREGNVNLLQTSMSPVANQINASHSTDNGAPEPENLIMDNSNAMNMEEGNKEDDEWKMKEAKEDGKKLEDEVKKSEEEKKEEEKDEKNPQITLITEDMLKLGNIKVKIFLKLNIKID